MNVNTGELRRFFKNSDFEELEKKGFYRVPDDYQEEAETLLKEKDSVMVDMKKETPLVNWAKKTKSDSKKKEKRKMSDVSRRKNRK